MPVVPAASVVARDDDRRGRSAPRPWVEPGCSGTAGRRAVSQDQRLDGDRSPTACSRPVRRLGRSGRARGAGRRSGRRPDPGVRSGMACAAGESMTSSESTVSRTRRAIRRLTLALMSDETMPPGRWVARTRWMPSDRPTAAILTSPSRKAGQLLGQHLELVDHQHQSGQPGVSQGRRSPGSPRCPWRRAVRAGCSRRLSSASSEARARAVRWPSRSVTRPTVWGRQAQSLNAEPPL